MSVRLSLSLDDCPDTVLTVFNLVRHHGVIAIPTESYYALGASPFDETAVQRVCEIKGRLEDKPILVLIGNRSQLADLVTGVPPAAELLMSHFWPGPLTLVLPAAAVPRALTSGTGTVGVRQPGYPPLLRLLDHIGPLTGTSANRTGVPPVTTADQVEATLGKEVNAILDGGPTPGGLPSTVIDATGPLHILREGSIGRCAIELLLDAQGFSCT